MKEIFNLVGNKCSSDEYFKIYFKICMICRPGMEAEDLVRIVRNDFAIDSGDHSKEIGPDKLFEGVFTAADAFSPTVNEADYQQFILMLNDLITYKPFESENDDILRARLWWESMQLFYKYYWILKCFKSKCSDAREGLISIDARNDWSKRQALLHQYD